MENLENQIVSHISLVLGKILVTMDKITLILGDFELKGDLMDGWLAKLRGPQGFATQETVLWKVMKNGPHMSGDFFSSAYLLFVTPTSISGINESHSRGCPHYMLGRLRR